MRVRTFPGMWQEDTCQLSDVMEVEDMGCEDYQDVRLYAQRVAVQQAKLIEILVERGVLTLADCITLGGPPMEAVE